MKIGDYGLTGITGQQITDTTDRENAKVREHVNPPLMGVDPVVHVGHHEQVVREAQQMLAALGHEAGHSGTLHNGVDGIEGSKTSTQIAKFQARHHLQADGEINEATQAALAHDFAVKFHLGSADFTAPGTAESARSISEAMAVARPAATPNMPPKLVHKL